MQVVRDIFTRLWKEPHRKKKTVRLTMNEILALCKEARESFLSQSSLLEIPAPIKVCGDIHGQYFDLLKLFAIGGKPPNQRYLFLGDYVDRGKYSLETICLLLSLKTLYPKSFFMIRGNHESERMNKKYGFQDEIKQRYRSREADRICDAFRDTFDCIPIAAVIDEDIFCCHGGIGPGLVDLDQIRRLKRPITLPAPLECSWVTDVLWSDPDENVNGWEKMGSKKDNPKHRGSGYLFGKDVLEDFLNENDLDMMCRAHQCVHNGYQWAFDGQVVTIFSAPNYNNRKNFAAVMKVPPGGSVGFQLFRTS